MAERYKQLFVEKKCIYTLESPVFIEARALLWDNKESCLIGQVKYKNIAEKAIAAMFITVTGYSVAGDHLLDMPYEYLDLNISRDTEFGSQTAISISNQSVRSFDISVDKVVFFDKTIWEKPHSENIELKPRQKLSLEPKLLEQYKNKTSQKSEFVPEETADLWFCSCGSTNRLSEQRCHECHCDKTIIFTSLNVDNLADTSNKQQYDLAKQKMSSASTESEYLDAKSIFTEISTFLDSSVLASQCAEKAEECRKENIYHEAQKKLADENIEMVRKAIEEFDSIIEWRDSKSKKTEAEEKVNHLSIKIKKKTKMQRTVAAIVAVSILAILLIHFLIIVPNNQYKRFLEACNSSDFREIKNTIAEMPSFKQRKANDKLFELGVNSIVTSSNHGKDYFDLITDDRASAIEHEYYIAAETAYNEGNRDLAKELYQLAGPEGTEQVSSIRYEEASDNLSKGEFLSAMTTFRELGDYKDSSQKYAESEYGVYNQTLDEIEKGHFDEAEQLLSKISDYQDIENGYDSLSYYRGLDKMKAGELEDAITLFGEVDNISLFPELNEKVKACSDGVSYMSAAGEVRNMSIRQSSDVQPAIQQINKVLAMPIGAAPKDYSSDLKTNLKYLDWYGKYVGTWDCTSSQDSSVMAHGGFADKYVRIVLNGDSSYCDIDGRAKLFNGKTTSDDGNYVFSGSSTLKPALPRNYTKALV